MPARSIAAERTRKDDQQVRGEERHAPFDGEVSQLSHVGKQNAQDLIGFSNLFYELLNLHLLRMARFLCESRMQRSIGANDCVRARTWRDVSECACVSYPRA